MERTQVSRAWKKFWGPIPFVMSKIIDGVYMYVCILLYFKTERYARNVIAYSDQHNGTLLTIRRGPGVYET